MKKTWTPCPFLCLSAKDSCPIQQQAHIFYSFFLLPSCLSPESTSGGLWLSKSHCWTIEQCLSVPSVPPLPALTSFMHPFYIWGWSRYSCSSIQSSCHLSWVLSFQNGLFLRLEEVILENQYEAPAQLKKTSEKHHGEERSQWAQSNRQQLLWTQSSFQDHPLLHCRSWGGLSVSCNKNKGNRD